MNIQNRVIARTHRVVVLASLVAVLAVSSIGTALVPQKAQAAFESWSTSDKIVEVASGTDFDCALTQSGKLYCWNTTPTQNLVVDGNVPTQISIPGKTIAQVSASLSDVCVVTVDGEAYCWGYFSVPTGETSVPTKVSMEGELAGKTVKSISVAFYVTCIIASDDQAYCMGSGGYSQLGNGSTEASAVPVAVDRSGVLAGKTIKDIQVTNFSVCVIASDDQVYCWGEGGNGTLGNGTTQTSAVPVAVDRSGVLAGKTIKDLNGDYRTYCVIASDNQLYCWGLDDQKGSLGVAGNPGDSAVPIAADLSQLPQGVGVRELADNSANGNGCFVATNDQVYCRGDNSQGALGRSPDDIAASNIAIPTSPGALAGKTIKKLTAGYSNTCVLASDDQLYCWGVYRGAIPAPAPGPGSTADILNVSFAEVGEKKTMVVNGILLGQYTDGLERSMVKLNGVNIPFCADGTGMTAEQLAPNVASPDLVSDSPPCYWIILNGGVAFSPTQVRVWLPDTFDMAARGTISVNGSSVYTFNPSDGGETPTAPTAGVDGSRPLDQHPIIKPLPTFSGVATPGATVTVTVHSDPVICTTTADSNGNWSCTLSAALPAGEHTVYVQVTNPDNSVENLGPYAVTVGETITNQTPTVPNTGVVSGVASAISILAIAVTLGLAALAVVRHNKRA